jgi:large subunit ribosomal protein L18
MNTAKQRLVERKKRAFRVRKKISGTASRPRMCVRRTLHHIYAQIVDDTTGKTIVQVGSRGKEFESKIAGKTVTKTDKSKIVGEILAERAKEMGISAIVFDRKGYLFHGRIKALAQAAREKGLSF